MLDKEKLLERFTETIKYANNEKQSYLSTEDTRMVDYIDGVLGIIIILEDAVKEGVFDKKS